MEKEKVGEIKKVGDKYYVLLKQETGDMDLHDLLVLYKLTLEHFKTKYPGLEVIAWRPQFSAEKNNHLDGLWIKTRNIRRA